MAPSRTAPERRDRAAAGGQHSSQGIGQPASRDYADSAYVASALRQIPGRVLAVGHSYGGAVITNAATTADNVVGLVYVAAFAPDEGETLMEVEGRTRDSVLLTALRPNEYPSGLVRNPPSSSPSIPDRFDRRSPPVTRPSAPTSSCRWRNGPVRRSTRSTRPTY
jgi:pimeloyl-ACP methyl ester carboxylesterase